MGKRLARGAALLLTLHLALPLLAVAAHAETGGAAGAAAGLRELGYSFAVILVFIGVIAYALGRSDIAKSSWAWAVVVAAIVGWVSSTTGSLPGAAGQAQVFCPPGLFYKYIPVSVVVAAPGRNVSATISWGDNSTSTCSGFGYCVASHSYGEEGVYSISVAGGVSRSCGVQVRSLGSELDRAFSGLEAECGWSPTKWPGCLMTYAAKGIGKAFGLLSDAVVWLLAHTGAGRVFERVGLMLVTVPETAPPLLDTHAYALFLLGYAVLGLALWRAFWEFEKGLSWLDALRDVAYVMLALSLAQPLYTWAARLVNGISVAMAQPGVLMAWMSMLLGFTALAAALPVGGAGGLAAAGVLGFAGFVLLALLKYLLLEAMYLLLPLVAVLWLFPGTRSVARSMTNVVVSLMAWNLVLAAMVGLSARALASPANASPLEVIGYGVAMPLAMLASGPMIAGMLGAPLPGAGLFAGIYGRLGGAVAARLGLQQAAQQPAAAAAAAPGAVVGHTEYLRPRQPLYGPYGPAASGAGHGYGTAAYPGVQTQTTHYLTSAGVPDVRGGEVVGFRPPPEPPQQPQQQREEKPLGVRERLSRAKEKAVDYAKLGPVRRYADRIAEETGRRGRAAKAAAVAGAAAGRLEAYFENRARQFVKEFATAFEKQTGIKMPKRLKNIQMLDQKRIAARRDTLARAGAQIGEAGAKIGKTIYIRIKKPISRLAARQYSSGAAGTKRLYDNA